MLKKVAGLLVSVAAVTGASNALAVGPDFSTLTNSVDFSTVTSAIMGIFAALATVYIVIRGGGLILSKIRR